MELGNEGGQFYFENQYEYFLKIIPAELKRAVTEYLEDILDNIAPSRDDDDATLDAWKQALEETAHQFQKIEL